MVLFKIFQCKKSDPNIHQNAPNCSIFKNFLGGACPRTPLAKRMASPCAAYVALRHASFHISKKNSWPPLPNPGDPLLIDAIKHIQLNQYSKHIIHINLQSKLYLAKVIANISQW